MQRFIQQRPKNTKSRRAKYNGLSLVRLAMGAACAILASNTPVLNAQEFYYSTVAESSIAESSVVTASYEPISLSPHTTQPISISSSYLVNSYPALSVFDFSSDPNWLVRVEAARKNLNASLLPNAKEAKQRLQNAMSQLESFLSTSPQHAGNWMSFLKWAKLKEELAKDAPNVDVLQDIEKTFRQNYFGLEMSQFTEVRDSLHDYVQKQRFSNKPDVTMELLGNRLKKLGERFKSAGVLSDGEAMHEIAQTVSYLAIGNQAAELVHGIRGAFSKPNARVLVSSEFLQRKFARPVSQPSPVNEVILGTTIVGNSILNGMVTPQLLNSPNMAQLRLNLNADFSSVNTGYNRSVRLQTQGSATVVACESIALSDAGLVSLGDTGADANLTSTINSIEHRLRLVRKIAAKQAAKQKPEADAIGESRLENRLRNQFHEQLGQQLSEANQKLNVSDPPILRRLGLVRPPRKSWSSTNNLALLWNVATGSQLGATGSCPLIVEPNGVTIQVHQSVVGNMLDPVLAGRVIRSQEIDQTISQFGDLAKGVQRKPDDQPWSITLHSFQPVEVQFEDSKVTYRIRTTRLDREDSSLTQPAVIQASYRFEILDGKIQMVRDGDIQIDFQGNQQRGAKAVTLRSVLKSKFEELFKPTLLDKPIDFKQQLPEQLKDIQLVSITTDEGWMQMHLR